MALEMRPECEQCTSRLDWRGEAFICSWECTFCGPCARDMDQVCPNCGGELLPRPRRRPSD